MKDAPSDSRDINRDDEIALRDELKKDDFNRDRCERLVAGFRARGQRQRAIEIVSQVAQDCQQHRRLTHAIELMRTLLKLAPERVDMHLKIGCTYLQLGDAERASMSFLHAFDCFFERDWLSDAHESLVHLERLQEHQVRYYVRKAKWMVRARKSQAAIGVFKACMDLLEADKDAYDFSEVGDAILLLRASDHAAGVQLGEILVEEANALVATERYEEAIQTLCWILKAAPKRLQTYRGLAERLTAKGYGESVIKVIAFVGQKLAEVGVSQGLFELASELTIKHEELEDVFDELGEQFKKTDSEGWPFQLIVDEFERLEVDEEWPVVEPAHQGLGDEPTSPARSARAAARDSESATEFRWGGFEWGQNLLDLLRRIDGISGRGCLRFFAEGESNPCAELRVQNHGVLMGAQVQDFRFGDLIDDGVIDADPSMREALCKRWEESAQETGAQGKFEQRIARVISVDDAKQYEVATAYALVKLVEIAQKTPLKMELVAHDGEYAALHFSSAILLMRAAAIICSQADTFEPSAVRDFGEERWVLRRVPESDCFLPVCFSGSVLSFRELEQTSRMVQDFVGQTQAIAPERQARGISVFSEKAIWGAVIKSEAAILARSSNTGIGRMLTKIRLLSEA